MINTEFRSLNIAVNRGDLDSVLRHLRGVKLSSSEVCLIWSKFGAEIQELNNRLLSAYDRAEIIAFHAAAEAAKLKQQRIDELKKELKELEVAAK